MAELLNETNATVRTDVLLDAAFTGRWDAVSMIQVLSELGTAVSLVTYDAMNLSNAESANFVTNFMVLLLCLLGGFFVADSFLGGYLTIIAIFTAVRTRTKTPLMLAAMHGKMICELLQDGTSSRRQPAIAEAERTSPKPPTSKRGPIPRERDLAVAAACRSLALVMVVVVVAISVTGAAAGSNTSLNITNHCSYTVWPGILSGLAAAALDTTGFELAPGESRSLSVPKGWSGLLWGRTRCSTDDTTGKFTCATGDCGSGGKECAGGGPSPPATLAQFTLDGSGGMDRYGVSLVDGFNLPVLVAPQPQGGNCALAGCVVDLNAACPAELRVTSAAAGTGTGTVACKSACLAFGSPQYCCTGEEYGNPETCKPSAYSELFKKACPRTRSYAYDGAGSTFTCAGGDGDTIGTYAITFCLSTTSGMPSTSRSSEPLGNGKLPLINGTPNTGGGTQVGSASAPWRVALVVTVLGVVTAVLNLLAHVLGLYKIICCSETKAPAWAAGEHSPSPLGVQLAAQLRGAHEDRRAQTLN